MICGSWPRSHCHCHFNPVRDFSSFLPPNSHEAWHNSRWLKFLKMNSFTNLPLPRVSCASTIFIKNYWSSAVGCVENKCDLLRGGKLEQPSWLLLSSFFALAGACRVSLIYMVILVTRLVFRAPWQALSYYSILPFDNDRTTKIRF